MDKRFRHFSKEDIWVLEKVHKKFSELIGNANEYHTCIPPAQKGDLKERLYQMIVRMWENYSFNYTAIRNIKFWKILWWFLMKLNIHLAMT